MDRLARKDKYGFSAVCENCPKHGMCNDRSDCEDVLAEKLIAYEDTGLEPEEITPRLRELAQADREWRVVVLPCNVGDTVYVIANCAEVSMWRDDDWENGTGATQCPFEDSCDIEDCDDDHRRAFKTRCEGFFIDFGGKIVTRLEHLNLNDDYPVWGKVLFRVKEEAETALKGGASDV